MSFETTTSLMEHQKAAFAKMLPTRIGALYMEMGTGKSRVVIELVKERLAKIDRVLWFTPVSLKVAYNVQDEILKHTNLCEKDIYSFDHRTNERNLPNALFYICGIESMSSSTRVILTINQLITERTFVVLDESTYIKGHRSQRTERITDYSAIARYRLILTGTPLTQGVQDLFAQMRFLSPKILGYRSFYSFSNNHLEYSKKRKGLIVRSHNTDHLAAKIAPYVYQVKKDECLDLPPKLHKSYYFRMTSEQEIMYRRAKEEILNSVMCDSDFETSILIFRLFTALQQITCGFWNRTEVESIGRRNYYGNKEMLRVPHRRIETLLDVLRNIPEQEKVTIWAKYQMDITAIKINLQKEFPSDSIAEFHGAISNKQRKYELDKFRAESRFLLATPSSGGHGLTLNECTYAIFYNNGFKYSERLQAEDRHHRIGQDQSVLYIDIVCLDSIDQRISQALAKKENVLESFKREIERVKKNKLKERLMGL